MDPIVNDADYIKILEYQCEDNQRTIKYLSENYSRHMRILTGLWKYGHSTDNYLFDYGGYVNFSDFLNAVEFFIDTKTKEIKP